MQEIFWLKTEQDERRANKLEEELLLTIMISDLKL